MQQAGVQIFRAGAALFLADGENDLDVAMGQILLFQAAQGFQDGYHAALVVAAQNGGAVGFDDAVFDAGLNAGAGIDAVHVGIQQDAGSACHGALKIRHKVACRAVQGFGSLHVFRHLAA